MIYITIKMYLRLTFVTASPMHARTIDNTRGFAPFDRNLDKSVKGESQIRTCRWSV